jgi:hypothetical protein
MIKQPFYVVAHNPNSVREAEDFLGAGANALGPDIQFENGEYYVSHHSSSANPLTEEQSLINYLRGLRNFIIDTGNLNLAMLFFDIKDPVFDINAFLAVVHQHFSRFPICSDVALMVSVPDTEHANFLLAYDQSILNAGIAIDQCSDPYEVHEVFKNSSQRNTAYGNGITTRLQKPGLFHSISEAKYLQAQGDGFKMVFAWVLAKEASMRSFLQLLPDAFLVDLEGVDPLLSILNEPEYAAKFELAKNTHNPWESPCLPSYSLTIKTRDTLMAGTDARIRFVLKGSQGMLDTVIDASFDYMMDRNRINHIVLQGEDIGIPESLTIELSDGGITSNWLPEFIELSSKLHESVLFSFSEDEWLKPQSPIIKNVNQN